MHLIDMSNKRANIAYLGEKPWHGLGFEMPKGADLDTWRVAAGLDWTAERANALYLDSKGAERVVDDRVILYRSDTGDALGIVSDRYQIVQPKAVVDFYEDLCDRHGFAMETMGSLKGGRIVWALAKTGLSTILPGSDRVNAYVLLYTSFDGSFSTIARFTSVRVVCNNTLTMAHGATGGISVATRHNTAFNADAVKTQLKIGDAFESFDKSISRLAQSGVTQEQAVKFFLDVYHDLTIEEAAKLSGSEKKSVDKTMERLAGILHSSPGASLPSAKGTVWGLLNAVTYDVDHNKRARSDESRLRSAWLGAGEALKNRAFEKAQKIAVAA